MFSFVVLLSLSLFCVQGSEPTTPAPPVSGNFGGTRPERFLFFENYLETGTDDQKAVYRDDNPLIREVIKEFNSTVFTQINGYLAHKSMLASIDKECDRRALEKSERLMQQAFNISVACVAEFRQRVRSEVDKSFTAIVDVPIDLRTSLIVPVDECLENSKFEAMKTFGQNLAEHIVCVKKIPQKKRL